MKAFIYIILIIFFTASAHAQKKPVQYNHKKGTIYTFWGWNAAEYGKSDMKFEGRDYDFTLFNVRAQDLPRRPIREPQNNYGIGYFFRDNWAIVASFDHMKYVMEQNQVVRIEGTISRAGLHQGEYEGDKQLTPDFLRFEHTDGLNYINIGLEKYFSWYTSNNQKLMVSGMVGGGAGILNPRTDAYLLDYPQSNRYHVSGFGFDLKAAAKVTVFKHVFGKIENKFGYINMPDIALHEKGIDGRAKQAFFFSEMIWSLGFNVSLVKQNKLENKKGNNY